MKSKLLLQISISFLLIHLISSNLFANYYDQGCRYYSYKKYDKAKEMFLKHIEIVEDGNSYYFLGEMEKIEGNFDKAQEYYKSAVSKPMIGKYKKLAYWNLIVIEEQKGRYNEMTIFCRELWDHMSDDGAKKKVEGLINKFLWTENDEAKSYFYNGIDFKKKNSQEKSKEAFYNALRTDSAFLAAKFEIGLLFLNENNFSQAINYFNDIISKIPFYGEVHLLLGDIYFNKQSYRNSIEHFTNAMEYGFLNSKTKYSVLLKLGTSYYETGNMEKAQEIFLLAADTNKKAVEPLLLLSAIYIKKNNFDHAIPILLKAKELNQNNTEIIFQIGSLYYKLNDSKYVQYFNQLLDKSISSKESIPQKYYKAFILLLKNNYEHKKYQDTQKIIEMLPDNQKNYEINLISAKTYYFLGKHEKAIENFEKLSLGNDDKYLLCISYVKVGMTSKAKEVLWNLSSINDYLEKAKSDILLKKIAYEVENEKQKKEEAKRNIVIEEKRTLKTEENKSVPENK